MSRGGANPENLHSLDPTAVPSCKTPKVINPLALPKHPCQIKSGSHIQSQAGCGSGQPGLVVGDPAHSRGAETRWTLWSFSTQAIPRFHYIIFISYPYERTALEQKHTYSISAELWDGFTRWDTGTATVLLQTC